MAAVTTFLWIAVAGVLQATTGRVVDGWNLPLIELVVFVHAFSPGGAPGIPAAIWGTVVRDSLSQAPLGAGFLPLLLVVFFAHACRGHLFRNSPITWLMCGFAAAAISISVQLVLAVTVYARGADVGGWHVVADLATVPLAGALLGPVVFAVVEGGNRALGIARRSEER